MCIIWLEERMIHHVRSVSWSWSVPRSPPSALHSIKCLVSICYFHHARDRMAPRKSFSSTFGACVARRSDAYNLCIGPVLTVLHMHAIDEQIEAWVLIISQAYRIVCRICTYETHALHVTATRQFMIFFLKRRRSSSRDRNFLPQTTAERLRGCHINLTRLGSWTWKTHTTQVSTSSSTNPHVTP
jgi:hypothetical protein